MATGRGAFKRVTSASVRTLGWDRSVVMSALVSELACDILVKSKALPYARLISPVPWSGVEWSGVSCSPPPLFFSSCYRVRSKVVKHLVFVSFSMHFFFCVVFDAFLFLCRFGEMCMYVKSSVHNVRSIFFPHYICLSHVAFSTLLLLQAIDSAVTGEGPAGVTLPVLDSEEQDLDRHLYHGTKVGKNEKRKMKLDLPTVQHSRSRPQGEGEHDAMVMVVDGIPYPPPHLTCSLYIGARSSIIGLSLPRLWF